MPLDFSGIDIDQIIKETGENTDAALAGRISSLTRLTDAEIQELFPKAGDAKKLVELMQIVKSAEDRNTKINRIAENSEKFAGIVLTLVEKFV